MNDRHVPMKLDGDRVVGVGDFDEDADDTCPNCGGEGVIYSCPDEIGCIDPEGGCDLCERRCDWCQPRKAKP